MPAGVTWGQYLRMLAASMLCMFTGAQVVHHYYLPDLSIPEIPPKPGTLHTRLLGLEAKASAKSMPSSKSHEEKPGSNL
uniref:Ubiquinol-cytochrome c reductase complex assembly factor 6 n=1 Tax=Eptatretus burgeri TaxID=7764 RepID=A0A8C4R9S3_EPTBU